MKKKQEVEDFIANGSENAVSRMKLRVHFKKSDRMIRSKIEDAQAKGYLIISKCNGDGYFQYRGAEDDYWFFKYIAMEEAKIRTMRKKIKKLKEMRRKILEGDN